MPERTTADFTRHRSTCRRSDAKICPTMAQTAINIKLRAVLTYSKGMAVLTWVAETPGRPSWSTENAVRRDLFHRPLATAVTKQIVPRPPTGNIRPRCPSRTVDTIVTITLHRCRSITDASVNSFRRAINPGTGPLNGPTFFEWRKVGPSHHSEPRSN